MNATAQDEHCTAAFVRASGNHWTRFDASEPDATLNLPMQDSETLNLSQAPIHQNIRLSPPPRRPHREPTV